MKQFKDLFLKTIPVMTGYICLGIGFGIMLGSKGYGIGWSILMSVSIYAGSMQYVAIDLISEGASLIAVGLTTLLVNARHLFYGISLIDRYKDLGKGKFYSIFGLTDETYSLVCQNKELSKKEIVIITLLDHLYWIVGCALGSLIGALIPWDFKGVDFVLTALFVCIFTEQWLQNKDHVPAIIGVVSTVACLLIFGTADFLIPSMSVITIALTILRKVRGEDTADE